MQGRFEILDILSKRTTATHVGYYIKYKDEHGKDQHRMVNIDRDDLPDYGIESDKGEFWITSTGVYLQKFV